MKELEPLVSLIEDVSGIVVPERDLGRLGASARDRIAATGQRSLEAYIQWLRLDRDGAEWRQLLSSITVNESYLFRAPQQFRAVAEVVLPELMASRGSGRGLRVWSAGCARGEEAVTLAMVLSESPETIGNQWRILATDVDEAALRDARRALYGRRAVEKVPPHLLETYLTRTCGGYELDARLRSRIDVRAHNLVRPELGFEPGLFDLIFLRNVLIYFRPASQRRVVAAISRVLAEDGFLFLGPSESLWQLSTDLVAVDLGDCFCYRHRSALGLGTPERMLDELQATPLVPPPARAPAVVIDTEGLDRPSEGSGASEAGPAPVRSLAPVIVALADDRIVDARELIREGLSRCPEDPLLRALEGLAYELVSETEAAVRCYRAALYLDPSLFQVRFLLARSMEGLGWTQRALREYKEALSALASPMAHEVPDWAVLGLPSRHQVEVCCLRLMARGRAAPR